MTDDLVRALIRERYSNNHWWATPPTDHPEREGAAPNFDDSELACAMRRRAAAEDFERAAEKEAG